MHIITQELQTEVKMFIHF